MQVENSKKQDRGNDFFFFPSHISNYSEYVGNVIIVIVFLVHHGKGAFTSVHRKLFWCRIRKILLGLESVCLVYDHLEAVAWILNG